MVLKSRPLWELEKAIILVREWRVVLEVFFLKSFHEGVFLETAFVENSKSDSFPLAFRWTFQQTAKSCRKSVKRFSVESQGLHSSNFDTRQDILTFGWESVKNRSSKICPQQKAKEFSRMKLGRYSNWISFLLIKHLFIFSICAISNFWQVRTYLINKMHMCRSS